MITIEQLQQATNCNALQQFIENYKFYDSFNRKMIGLSFLENENSFVLKYYLEIKKQEINQIKEFKEQKKLENKIAFNIPTSLAVGIKIDNSFNYTNYLHAKFDRNLILKPKSIKIKCLDQNNLKYGMSIEKTKFLRKLKKYFYVYKEKEKTKSLFNIDVDTSVVDHFELYETKNNTKINIIFDFYNETCVSKFLDQNNLKKYHKNLKTTNEFFNKIPVYAGLDKNKNLSVYYSFTKTA